MIKMNVNGMLDVARQTYNEAVENIYELCKGYEST